MKDIEVRGIHRLSLLGSALLAVASCTSPTKPVDDVAIQRSAITLSTSNVELQESENSCWGNGAQTYFRVKNNDPSAIKLSDITIKFWVNDTSGSPVVPHVAYGGCVTNAGGTCVHPVSNVSATASPFTACGPDAQHQANWEITISTTDATTIASGFTWSNIQSSINLASYAPFSPGSSTWYSSCGTGQPFHPDARYSVYVRGDLVTTLGITPPDCRAPHGSQPITSYAMPPASPKVGSLPKDKVLTIALTLPLRNTAALQAKIDAASDPSSPTYRQWLTFAELEADYLPPASDFSTLKAWAAAKGLQVSSQPSHKVAGLIGTVAQIERAFFVNMITALRSDGTTFYAPDRRPTLDLVPLVQGVSSLDSFARPIITAAGGRGPISGSFQSNDFRDAYLGQAPSACAALTGAGQSIGVYAFGSGIDQGDIDRYVSKTGLTGVLQPKVVVAGTPDGTTPAPLPIIDDYSGEITVDAEMAIAMAPGAQVVLFEGNDMTLILDAMVNSSDVAQFTSSFSSFNDASESNPKGDAEAHMLIAARGHAFFQSSGDDGPYPAKFVSRPPGATECRPRGAKAVWDMPFITFVGGTNIDLNAGAFVDESAWASSGGGILPFVPMPEYQANANPANLLLSTTSRNVPDVAMVATNVFTVHSERGISHIEDTTNGTSVSTPLWAGFMALANQARTTPGLIGFPNPAIYAIGKDPAKYGASFRDIKDGLVSPACDGTPYSPREGYDQVTGWGTPTCGLIATINNTVLKRVLTVDGAIDDLVDLEGGSNHLGRQPFLLAIPVNQSTPTGSQVFSTCLNNLLGAKIVFTAALSPVDFQTIHACVSEGLHRTSSAIILTRLYGNPDANLSLRVTAGQGQVFHYVNEPCGPAFCNPFFFPATGNAGTTGGSFPNITPPANGILPFDIEVEHGAGGTVLIDAQGSYHFATGQISGFDPSGALYQPDPAHPDEFCAHDSATHVTLCWKFETNVDLTACTGNIPTDTPRCWDLPADGGKRIDDGGLFSQPGAAVGTYGALLLNVQDPNP